MLLLCVLSVIVAKDFFVSGAVVSNEVDDKELLLTFVVNRHGERTPAEEEADLSAEKGLLRQLTLVEGYEGLTNEGKRRAYQIGKFLRQRYGMEHSLLSKMYLQEEIKIRSTDKERTKMTAQIAMAALYPPESVQQWDSGLGKIWQPVPYTTVPLSQDYLRFYSNCDYYKGLLQQAKAEALHQEFEPYLDLIPLLKQKTGANFTEDLLLFETLHDLFSSQVVLRVPLPKWSIPLLPRLTEAATLAYRLYFRSHEMSRFAGGILLNDFMAAANEIIAGGSVHQPVRMYSAHDFNLGGLMQASRVVDAISTLPQYGALFALELYRSRETKQYLVLPVHLPQAGSSSAIIRRIDGCDDEYCDFDTFRNITVNNLMREEEFYDLCQPTRT